MTKVNSSTSAVTNRQIKTFKRQRIDRLNDLRVGDPVIDRDARMLGALREIYRRNSVQRSYWPTLKTLPALYCRLRGPRLPLKQGNGKQVPRWRSLSPWMKVQVAMLVLAERGYMQFKVHLHDDLRVELEARGVDQKNYLRDRIMRCLRTTLGEGQSFFFVMEDTSDDGQPTRPHAHGSIEVRRLRLPQKGEPGHLHFRRLAEREGLEEAERQYGELRTKEALRAASGNLKGDRPRLVNGLDQFKNVWTRRPTRPFMNDRWVTYAFKNEHAFSATLGDNRLAFSQALRTEARRVWELIRQGESAIAQWSQLAP